MKAFLSNSLDFCHGHHSQEMSKAGELPQKPLQGVRLFFLDLRFSPNVDSKTIISNASHILKAILGESNGPYLLIIWSSTGDEYKEELENELKDKLYRPEFILCLSKGDLVPSSGLQRSRHISKNISTGKMSRIFTLSLNNLNTTLWKKGNLDIFL